MKGDKTENQSSLEIAGELIDILVDEVKENLPLPSIIIAILAALKYFN